MGTGSSRRAPASKAIGAIAAIGAIGALLTATGTAEASFRRGPYVQDLGSRGFALLLELDAPSTAKLVVSTGTGATVREVSSTSDDTTHELVVSGLEPATTYGWTLTTGDGATERGTLTSAPEDDRAFSFLLYGDNRSNPYAHAAVVQAMRKAPADFLVHTGDMVYDGSQPKDWADFFAIERELLRERCLFPAIGNHEIAMPTSDGALRYARMFRVPAPAAAAERWYTFRWGSARFFVLDAHDEFATSERAWLEGALSAASAEPGLAWRFVVLHHGPYSSGLHGGNESLLLANVPELLRKHRVDLVFSGHDHVYERGDANGLRYVISGGGGAPLYKQFRNAPTTQKFEPAYHFLRLEVTSSALTMLATRHDGSTLERCALPRGGATGWSCGAQPPPATAVAVTGAPATDAPKPAPERRACSCDFVGMGTEWIGLAVAGALASAAGLRRGTRTSGGRDHEA